MVEQKSGGDLFKMNFMVIFCTVMINFGTSRFANHAYFRAIEDVEKIREFNWCAVVIDSLVKSKNQWAAQRNNEMRRFYGPLTFLMICKVMKMIGLIWRDIHERFVQLKNLFGVAENLMGGAEKFLERCKADKGVNKYCGFDDDPYWGDPLVLYVIDAIFEILQKKNSRSTVSNEGMEIGKGAMSFSLGIEEVDKMVVVVPKEEETLECKPRKIDFEEENDAEGVDDGELEDRGVGSKMQRLALFTLSPFNERATDFLGELKSHESWLFDWVMNGGVGGDKKRMILSLYFWKM